VWRTLLVGDWVSELVFLAALALSIAAGVHYYPQWIGVRFSEEEVLHASKSTLLIYLGVRLTLLVLRATWETIVFLRLDGTNLSASPPRACPAPAPLHPSPRPSRVQMWRLRVFWWPGCGACRRWTRAARRRS
jgi:hypothetical protein